MNIFNICIGIAILWSVLGLIVALVPYARTQEMRKKDWLLFVIAGPACWVFVAIVLVVYWFRYKRMYKEFESKLLMGSEDER